MQIAKLLLLTPILTATLLLQGCSTIDVSSCDEVSQTTTVGPGGVSTTTTGKGGCGRGGHQTFWRGLVRTVYAYTGFQAYNLDFSQFRMDISTHNAQFQNQPGSLSIILFNGDHSIAERQFAYNASGNTLILANPQAVQHWAAGFEGIADGYSVNITGMQLTNAVGQHSFNATAKLGNQHLATFNWQGYASNDCDTCVMK